jgi:hypothetical protein
MADSVPVVSLAGNKRSTKSHEIAEQNWLRLGCFVDRFYPAWKLHNRPCFPCHIRLDAFDWGCYALGSYSSERI